MITYGFEKEVNLSIDELEKKVVLELKKEGFGILTKIDIKDKFKKKLGVDFKNYRILGACNSPSAYKAISEEENIGLMLPCNVVIYETSNIDICKLSIIKPSIAMNIVDNSVLGGIAKTIESKLENVFKSI